MGRWRRIQTVLLVVGVVLVPWLLVAPLTREEKQWTLIVFCLSAALLRILFELLATRLVPADDDISRLQGSLDKISPGFGDDLERLAR